MSTGRRKGNSYSRQGCEVQIVELCATLWERKNKADGGFWQTPCPRSSFEWSSAMEIATDQSIQV